MTWEHVTWNGYFIGRISWENSQTRKKILWQWHTKAGTYSYHLQCLGGRSFHYGPKNRCQIPSHPFAICYLLWVTLGPIRSGTDFHGWHHCVARCSCWWVGSCEGSWKAGPQASVGSSLLCFFGHFVPFPRTPPPSPSSSTSTLHFHNKYGLLFQFLWYWLIKYRSEGCRNTSAQDVLSMLSVTPVGSRSSKKGMDHFLDSSGERWVAFLVFSLSTQVKAL